MTEKTSGLALQEKTIAPILGNGSGNHALQPKKNLPPANQISNEHLIAEEKRLIEKEIAVEQSYQGWRGYWRLWQVSKVIGGLALYLYLDQYDLHHAQHQKKAEARMTTAQRLTWLAVLGEQFHKINLWFFHQTMLLLRRYFIGGESNKLLNQEKEKNYCYNYWYRFNLWIKIK